MQNLTISIFLEKLAKKAKLSSLQLNETGVVSLNIDNEVYGLHYFGNTDEVYVISKLGQLPEQEADKMTVAARLLDMNCFFNTTGNGIIGVPSGSNVIYYTVRISMSGLTYQDFKKSFFNAVDICINLRQNIFDTSSNIESASNLEFITMLKV